MFSNDPGMKDTGLDKAVKSGAVVKTRTSGEFDDCWGGELEKLDKTLALLREAQLAKFAHQTFYKGDTVRKRGRTDITGKVMAQSKNDVAVDWSDGERAMCDSRELIKA
jgi:hypothetical protein